MRRHALTLAAILALVVAGSALVGSLGSASVTPTTPKARAVGMVRQAIHDEESAIGLALKGGSWPEVESKISLSHKAMVQAVHRLDDAEAIGQISEAANDAVTVSLGNAVQLDAKATRSARSKDPNGVKERLRKAISAKQSALRLLENAHPPQPALAPIHAVFTPPAAGTACAPPACTTVYTETVSSGEDLTYTWTVSIPADPNCAKGFQPNTPTLAAATWYHADESQGGPCNHTGTTYDSAGAGHPGTVTVVVANAYWSCTATYYGTQGANGLPTGDGPAPEPCNAE